MGRMLEALKRAEGKRAPVAPPAPAQSWPESEQAEDQQDVPFIEVGGPRAANDVSTIVLADSLNPPPIKTIVGDRPPLMSVAFKPLPVGVSVERGPARLSAELVAYHQPHHPISGQYRDLATNMLGQLAVEKSRLLLFTATGPGVGTTTVVLNTAITLARRGLRVVVIDAHLRRSAVALRLGLPEKPGLREILGGQLVAEETLQKTGVANLVALTAGSSDVGSPTRLVGEAMRGLLRRLREQFDLVLIDGPNWDGRPEVVALGSACEAVYLCLPEKEQETPGARELLEIIPEQGAKLCGCILTS